MSDWELVTGSSTRIKRTDQVSIGALGRIVVSGDIVEQVGKCFVVLIRVDGALCKLVPTVNPNSLSVESGNSCDVRRWTKQGYGHQKKFTCIRAFHMLKKIAPHRSQVVPHAFVDGSLILDLSGLEDVEADSQAD